MAIVGGLSRLEDPTRLRACAYRIVANKARDWVRREQARRCAEDAVSRPERVEPLAAADDGALNGR